MMKKWMLFCLMVSLFSCRNQSEGKLTWRSDKITHASERDVVTLIYPVAQGTSAADSINAALQGHLRQTLFGASSAQKDLPLEELLDTLLVRKSRDSILASSFYQIHSESKVYTAAALTSVWIQCDTFLGGAHGLTTGRYFNFDNRTGEQFRLEELVKDTLRLRELNRTAFGHYLQEKGVTQPATVLFVQLDQLPLPKNIGFDSMGIAMLYNPYEIGPYVLGQPHYSIPYQEARGILRKIAKPN